MGVRLVGLVLLGACGFQFSSNTGDAGAGSDGGGDDALIDAPPDMMLVDGNHPGWWDARWMHRRKITLDTTRLSGPVTDFPVLIRFPALTGVASNGADIRFVEDDGPVSFPYELDTFSLGGASFAWVRMTLSPAADTDLWIYYGNAMAAAESSGAAVFASAHVSVHHFGGQADATGHSHSLTSATNGTTPTLLPNARIGAGRTFDGNDDYFALDDSNGPYDFTTEMSASAWVHVTGFEDVYQAIITKGDSSWRLARAEETNGAGFGWNSSQNLNGNMSIVGVGWHHIAIVKTTAAKLLYVDGMLDENLADTVQLATNERSVRFGMNEESTTDGARYWHGDMDEIRISVTPRDLAWVNAEFITTDPAFVSVADPEDY